MAKVKTKPAQYEGHPRVHELLAELGTLHANKNHDYAAGAAQGPLGNFTRVSRLLREYPQGDVWTSPTGIALIYMLKQLDAALIMLSTAKTSRVGEGLHERLKDIAAYAILTMVLHEEGEKQ